jgi:hypothetical protein
MSVVSKVLKCLKSTPALTLLSAVAWITVSSPAAQAQNVNSLINQGLGIYNQTTTGNSRGLPPTNTDSFVYQAGGMADLIYGDESNGLPPFFGFTQEHRINAGIFGQNDAGLTTGHGSFLPDAWGADEFIGNEWSWAGASNGNAHQIGATALNAADLLEAVVISVLDLWDTGAMNVVDSSMQNATSAITGAMQGSVNGISGSTSGLGGGLGSSTGF